MPSRAHHQFPVGAEPRFEADLTAGELRVRNGGPGSVSITIDAADPGAVEVVRTGDTIAVRKPTGWANRRRNVVVDAVVPPGCEIVAHAASASMRLDGRFGTTRLHTISGDIEVEHLGRAEIDSTSGDVQLASGDQLEVATISGDVTVRHVRGRLRASLTSGDLRADRVDGDAEVATMSGDVVIGHCSGDDISLRTVSGDLRLGLPSGIRVEPDINTVSGRTTLPPPASPAGGPRRRVRLRLRTVSGDIRLERV